MKRADKAQEEPKVMDGADEEEVPPSMQQKDCTKGRPERVPPWYERLLQKGFANIGGPALAWYGDRQRFL